MAAYQENETGTLVSGHFFQLYADWSETRQLVETKEWIVSSHPDEILGMRAEIGPARRHWSVNAYVTNLTGAEYIMAAFATSPAAFGGRQGPSREAGVQAILRR